MAVIELTFDGDDEHILADSSTLCADACSDEDARVVPHSRDPVADASVHLCALCARRWERLRDKVERSETVRCAVDRCEDDTMWTCAKLVAATEARKLDHPDADEAIPACPDCYDWLREYPGNEITTAYEDAATWVADAHI